MASHDGIHGFIAWIMHKEEDSTRIKGVVSLYMGWYLCNNIYIYGVLLARLSLCAVYSILERPYDFILLCTSKEDGHPFCSFPSCLFRVPSNVLDRVGRGWRRKGSLGVRQIMENEILGPGNICMHVAMCVCMYPLCACMCINESSIYDSIYLYRTCCYVPIFNLGIYICL